ncbi:MAG: hypothetical protein P1V51_23235 [Deltaproteobacteria bacterium]|nr:hypothetical protein [Deltaproteobacteria bacterium]
MTLRLQKILAPLAALLLWAGPALASDPPHNQASTGINCANCHQGHRGRGMSLTTVDGNKHACLSCHKDAQTHLAAFNEADQANQVTKTGLHHRWDTGLAGYVLKTSTANGSTGEIESGGAFSGSGVKTYTVTISQTGSDTAARFDWTGVGSAGGAGTSVLCGTDVVLNEGITLSCKPEPFADAVGSCGQFFCAGDIFTVEVSSSVPLPQGGSPLRLMEGKVSCSTCHNQHLQTAASHTSRTVNGDLWKHFMAIDNDAGQLCRECHTDRFPDSGDPNYPFDLTRSHTTTNRSHPVGVVLNANGKGYDRAVPLDANGGVQGTGEADGISSNDLLLGAGGVVTCLTCHGVHSGAADSNSQTE